MLMRIRPASPQILGSIKLLRTWGQRARRREKPLLHADKPRVRFGQ